MLDALLYAVRNAIRSVNDGQQNIALRYDERNCEIMANGQPKANCGDIFVAVHEGPTRSTQENSLNDYYSFMVTVTQRVVVPLDRVGDQLLAKQLASNKAIAPGGISFNARCEQLRSFLHMNWGILQDANNNLVNWTPDAESVYGFSEPARYRGMETPILVGPDWFWAEEGSGMTGLKSELHFEDCRRLQAIASFT